MTQATVDGRLDICVKRQDPLTEARAEAHSFRCTREEIPVGLCPNQECPRKWCKIPRENHLIPEPDAIPRRANPHSSKVSRPSQELHSSSERVRSSLDNSSSCIAGSQGSAEIRLSSYLRHIARIQEDRGGWCRKKDWRSLSVFFRWRLDSSEKKYEGETSPSSTHWVRVRT